VTKPNEPPSAPSGLARDGDCVYADDQTERLASAAERRRRVSRVFWLTLGLNAIVALSKAGYGLFSGSLTLGTDSLHSVLDASSNVLALLGLRWSAAPADARHPYGRRKVEILAALGIGALIVIGLFEFGEAAVRALLEGRHGPRVGLGGFAVVLGTMVINFFVTRYEHRKGHELGSELLHADARHTQSDLYASAAVIASFAAVRAGLSWADGVATLMLVGLIGHAAWEVFRDNVPILLDAARLDPAGVAELARTVAGVSDVHRVRSRGMRTAVELDLHLEVAANMPVSEAHALARKIEREVKVKFPEVSDVVIHIEPATRDTEPQEASRILDRGTEFRPPPLPSNVESDRPQRSPESRHQHRHEDRSKDRHDDPNEENGKNKSSNDTSTRKT
jgi:cation diffusion facilitator family transporter